MKKFITKLWFQQSNLKYFKEAKDKNIQNEVLEGAFSFVIQEYGEV